MSIRIDIPAASCGGPAKGTKLSEYLAQNGYDLPAPCGGNGTCGKCRVTLETVTGNSTKTEEVQACQTMLSGEACAVSVAKTGGSGSTESIHGTAENAQDSTPVGFALDIGTTTLAMGIVAKDGRMLCVTSALNPERSFGADVMSRISSIMEKPETLSIMQRLLAASVTKMIVSLTETYCGDAAVPRCLSVTGNTTMLHIFRGISPVGMGAYPFTPVFLDEVITSGNECGLADVDTVILSPSAGAFIGADITAGAAALGFCTKQETAAFIDIGTNGEMLLLHNGHLYGASAAAGPAMEGAGISTGIGGIRGAVCAFSRTESGEIRMKTIGDAPPIGICGSGLIDLIAYLLDAEIIDETGYMDEDVYVYAVTEDGVPLSLTSADIRAFQLAKSAIRAGLDALCDIAEIKVSSLDRIYLAGGLGYYMNTASAVRVGLLPDGIPFCTVGNTAFVGAGLRLARGDAFGAMVRDLAARCETKELNASAVFSDAFMEHMLFPITDCVP